MSSPANSSRAAGQTGPNSASGAFFDELFTGAPLMAILRGYSRERTLELAERAWELGVRAVEVPVQSQDAVETLAAVAARARELDRIAGAGTVVSSDLVRLAGEAGAAFTVAPGFDEAVADESDARGMPHLPGVATASEIQRVLSTGRTWMKAFPADALGERWFSGMRGPFPHIRIVATGGMSAGNARHYLDAGADVVAVGSALGDPQQLPLLAELMSQTRTGDAGHR
ncbi:bifunctional 4-hydroxy-2-oxoglutarate aldolase/2-dehydro-3-deoxy-phosphogluconate aldolase [Ruicaihuangia caeni]|uniref:bifunctional 4-hydroxy-2-oxoglutarate aldolase/2-dehydro-3-deoxy-phosphogluconate aldolase n=1 Tax=Ruicaihuangia caeni TaxID=3042517 RepID=UPI00338E92AB